MFFLFFFLPPQVHSGFIWPPNCPIRCQASQREGVRERERERERESGPGPTGTSNARVVNPALQGPTVCLNWLPSFPPSLHLQQLVCVTETQPACPCHRTSPSVGAEAGRKCAPLQLLMVPLGGTPNPNAPTSSFHLWVSLSWDIRSLKTCTVSGFRVVSWWRSGSPPQMKGKVT